MVHLTEDQISRAQDNDLDAVTAVIAETEPLIASLARRYATGAGWTDESFTEDLEQVGRMAVWDAIRRFEGGTPAKFMAFARGTVIGMMTKARKEHARPGVSIDATETFEQALSMSGGDPFEAEKLAASDAMGKDKLSPDLAYAARLSWLGLDSLDRPAGESGDGTPVTLGQLLADEIGIPAELLESRDIARHRTKVIREQVHHALGLLSERQRHVLKAGHGILPVPLYRIGTDDAELAADMDATPYQVQQARTKGQKRFAELYTAGARQW
ncbi:sigma-70 family RNA polymerase sigma factor [Streptomyces sp. NPDC085665]|uniref:sigma-70 family RNA polymerase sigma factor n=1 Tax=Streptomyces sp. NPDC085665 TaxID=3365735 RepID=UPI0037D361C5